MKAHTIREYNEIYPVIRLDISTESILGNLRYCDEITKQSEMGTLPNDCHLDDVFEGVFELINQRRLIEEGDR